MAIAVLKTTQLFLDLHDYPPGEQSPYYDAESVVRLKIGGTFRSSGILEGAVAEGHEVYVLAEEGIFPEIIAWLKRYVCEDHIIFTDTHDNTFYRLSMWKALYRAVELPWKRVSKEELPQYFWAIDGVREAGILEAFDFADLLV